MLSTTRNDCMIIIICLAQYGMYIHIKFLFTLSRCASDIRCSMKLFGQRDGYGQPHKSNITNVITFLCSVIQSISLPTKKYRITKSQVTPYLCIRHCSFFLLFYNHGKIPPLFPSFLAVAAVSSANSITSNVSACVPGDSS